MLIFDVYGIDMGSLEEAKQLVDELLGVVLKCNDSSFCLNYYHRFSSGEGFTLRKNIWDSQDEDGGFDGEDGTDTEEPIYREPQFKEFAILLCGEDMTESTADECKVKLLRSKQVAFLRRDEL